MFAGVASSRFTSIQTTGLVWCMEFGGDAWESWWCCIRRQAPTLHPQTSAYRGLLGCYTSFSFVWYNCYAVRALIFIIYRSSKSKCKTIHFWTLCRFFLLIQLLFPVAYVIHTAGLQTDAPACLRIILFHDDYSFWGQVERFFWFFPDCASVLQTQSHVFQSIHQEAKYPLIFFYCHTV